VDLVDEEDVAAVEVRQQRRQVARALEHGARRRTHAHAELVRDDVRERRLAEPGRPAEEHVVQHVAARARGLDLDAQVLAHLLLSDVLVERARPERRLDDHLVFERLGHHGVVVASSHQPASPIERVPDHLLERRPVLSCSPHRAFRLGRL
jgi:hypothetical protein